MRRPARCAWSAVNGDPKKGETGTSAPMVIKDKVLVGISGGEFGVQGHVTAYDINSGELVWRGYSTGPDDQTLMDPAEHHPSRPAGRRRLGHGHLGRRSVADRRRHDLGLDVLRSRAQPGLLRHRQSRDLEPGAAAGRQPLVDDHLRPRRRHRHGQVGLSDDAPRRVGLRRRQRDDPRRPRVRRRDRARSWSTSTATASATRSIARPASCWSPRSTIRRSTGRPTSTWRPGGRRWCRATRPTSRARTSTPPTSARRRSAPRTSSRRPISPETGLFYVPTNHVCMDYEPFAVSYTAGQPYVGATLSMYPAPGGDHLGNFIAWDAAEGEIVWSIPEPFSVWSGALATAGDVVFYGTLEGYLKAVDAETGAPLYQFKTPSGIIGNVNTWMHNGKQYVGVLSGIGGWAGIGLAAGPDRRHRGSRRGRRVQGAVQLHPARRRADGVRAALTIALAQPRLSGSRSGTSGTSRGAGPFPGPIDGQGGPGRFARCILSGLDAIRPYGRLLWGAGIAAVVAGLGLTPVLVHAQAAADPGKTEAREKMVEEAQAEADVALGGQAVYRGRWQGRPGHLQRLPPLPQLLPRLPRAGWPRQLVRAGADRIRSRRSATRAISRR